VLHSREALLKRRCAQFLITLLLPALAAAQSARPAPTTIQVTSRIVYVDVVVRDGAGHIVHGLTKKDFRVFEDGKPQHIDYFAVHSYNPAAPAPKPASSLAFSNTGKPGQSSAVTILLFDLLNTSTRQQLVACEQMLKFLKALPPGRRISLFTLTDRLQMIQSFTGSPQLLAAAAKMLKPVDVGQMPSNLEVAEEEATAHEFDVQAHKGINAGMPEPGGSSSPEMPTAMDGNIQTQDTNLNIRTFSTISALTQLARIMSPYQGRKNLFWVSWSFPIALNTTHNFLGQTLPVDARRMSNVLASARIAVYPVSVRGLTPYQNMAEFFTNKALKASMNDIADQTGGQAIVSTNDLAGAMRRDLDDASNFYTLAYQPQNKKWNKKFRTIRVELAQKGDTLAYRRGYFAYPGNAPAPNPIQRLNVALQPETPESTSLALHSTVDLPDAQHSTILVHSNLSAANLNLVPAADGHRRGQLFVCLIAFKDDPGKPAAQPAAPPQSSGILNLNFTPAEYQSILKSGIAFTQQLQLPPGQYRLRLGVSDLTSQRLGTLDMPITIPASAAHH